MLKIFTIIFTLLAVVVTWPARLVAASGQAAQILTGSLRGMAHGSGQQALAQVAVQARNLATGQIGGVTSTSQTGAFAFEGLNPGNYVVEIIEGANHVVGLSASVAVTAGQAATVSVTASAAGAMAAAAGGGFGLMGLGTSASIAAVAAAGAVGTVVAVKATRPNASPAR